MSYSALRSLPYDESEDNSSLLPARLVRPSESAQSSSVIELKLVLEQKDRDITPSLSRVVENNGVPTTFPEPPPVDSGYPRWLINIFGSGLVILAVGLTLLVVSVFTHATSAGVASASCLVIGTAAIALSLLRGEDIEGLARQ